MLRNKELSAAEITRAHLDRIEKLDPKLHAFLYIDKQGAQEKAEILDKSSDFSAPMAGVPLALKDVITTTDMPTTAASKILEGYVSPYEATVTSKLREAGAIFLGKTNLDEFAMGSSTENSGYQKTMNPWDLERVPGGSGGGSATAVTADLTVAALGTDTGGSIRQPAAFTGSVGLKPTYGLVSRYGVIALASSLDQVGPVTKNVSDCAYLLDIIAGLDPNDATNLMHRENYYEGLNEFELKGLKIGLPKEYFGAGINPQISAQIKELVHKIELAGAFVEEVSVPHSEEALSVYYIILPSEASSNLARYDGIRYGARAQATSVLDTYLKTRELGLGDEPKRRIILGTYALSAGYADEFYKKAVTVQQLIRQDFVEAFKKVDLMISPTAPSVAFKFGAASTPLQMYMNDILTLPINLAGNCAISIPAGLVDNLPIGLQIIGPHLGEKKVLQLAKKIEDFVQFDKLGEPHGIA